MNNVKLIKLRRIRAKLVLTFGLLTSLLVTLASSGSSVFAASDGVELRGLVSDDGSIVDMYSALAIDNPTTGSDPKGTHEFILRNNTGAVVHRVRFTPIFSGPGHGNPRGILSIVVPQTSIVGGGRVELQSRGKTLLYSRKVSANAPRFTAPPTVKIGVNMVTVSWNVSDADGDAITYAVDYSGDGGKTWTLCAIDIKDQTVDLERWGLDASDNAIFRVIATDGLRSTIKDTLTLVLPRGAR